MRLYDITLIWNFQLHDTCYTYKHKEFTTCDVRHPVISMHEEETGEVGGSSAFKRVSANEEKKVYENNRIASTIPLFSCILKSRDMRNVR